jgi:hypothetical protein
VLPFQDERCTQGETFVNLTIDSLGSAPSSQSPGRTGIECGKGLSCEVTASKMRSSLISLKMSGEHKSRTPLGKCQIGERE